MNKIILYIGSMQRGGANRVMANLADYFCKVGVDVVLVNDIFPNPLKPEYTVNPFVRRYFLDENGHGGRKIKRLIRRMSSFRKLVKKEKPDTIVSFMAAPNYRMLISTLGIKVRKIVSVRNDPYKEYGNGIKKIITNMVFGLADGCVFQTWEASEYFFKIIRSRSRIIFNPVDEKFYSISREADAKNIVTVGRLEKQKNHRLLIDAFSRLSCDFPDEKLLIYGEGGLRSELELYVHELNLSDRVLFKGITTDIGKALSSAKVFVLSSNYEGMPNALMEAMVVGVPVVSTNCPCGGPRMLISNEEQGMLVDCYDESMLADAVRSLLVDGSMRKKLGEGAKEKAKEFHPDIIFKQWYDYISLNDKKR